VFSFAELKAAWREDQSPRREHVTSFLYLHPERFKIKILRADHDWFQLCWTVDTPEDLVEFVRSVFDYFGRTRFSWRQALDEGFSAHRMERKKQPYCSEDNPQLTVSIHG